MKVKLMLLAGITTAAIAMGTKPPTVTSENSGEFYKGYHRLTKEAQYVAPLTALLCSMPSKETLAREEAMTGPHTRVSVHYYANPTADKAIAAKATTFPVGTVIVKEKLGNDRGVTAVAGMIKRPPGYDAANDDWEFFFHTLGGEFHRGKLAHCIDCHTGASRDHVFAAWKLPAK